MKERLKDGRTDRGTDGWTDGRTDLKCAITEKIGNLIKILNIEKKVNLLWQ